MGVASSSSMSKTANSSSKSRELKGLFTERVRLLQEEINGIVQEREKEAKSYKREVMVFALKEGEWRRERKRLREEVRRLRKVVEEKDERIKGMMEGGGGGGGGGGEMVVVGEEWGLWVEQMTEERARRDEAVEKWKQLYLTIKMELDDLIQTAHCGEGRLCWRPEEEEVVEELKRELRAKEETIEALKSHLASLEQDKHKSERETDILRQSLRIMSNKNGALTTTGKLI
ncbi:uncharacterized protein LOC104417158 [Eucalyptus grandis]|uniref:Uncharacterized protein n=2 Tax=Eucalyptus grandis TaxID=71139 RepID=A0ACC3JSU7_EUCGR|nr:uncharacterized protein LOC104417158 [Eucalyptus grandis]KAK3417127.1 hypothetical protein EUGRSUZ_H02876 [Eucalyptus grandis]